ncbi:hypothetical protein [Streptomyces xinghaiensis]|uniref:hypothetical protein n=1 Tax=Streptomyces xinghaiensis TaxID=1038928 RepID=UPI002E11C289|nr:hypothetical protein OG463_07730 [Streptomyces xinghaiensis]
MAAGEDDGASDGPRAVAFGGRVLAVDPEEPQDLTGGDVLGQRPGRAAPGGAAEETSA